MLGHALAGSSSAESDSYANITMEMTPSKGSKNARDKVNCHCKKVKVLFGMKSRLNICRNFMELRTWKTHLCFRRLSVSFHKKLSV